MPHLDRGKLLRVHHYLYAEQRRKLEDYAKNNGITLAQAIRQAVLEFLKINCQTN